MRLQAITPDSWQLGKFVEEYVFTPRLVQQKGYNTQNTVIMLASISNITLFHNHMRCIILLASLSVSFHTQYLSRTLAGCCWWKTLTGIATNLLCPHQSSKHVSRQGSPCLLPHYHPRAPCSCCMCPSLHPVLSLASPVSAWQFCSVLPHPVKPV